MDNSKLVCVSGNICSGKTSLVEALGSNYGWTIIPEPHEENPFLVRFYSNMRRWAFPSQIYFLSKRFSLCRKSLEINDIVIQDRTIFEDAEIFTKYLYITNVLDSDQFNCYHELYMNIFEFIPIPHVIVYLYTSPDILMQRIINRGRKYEKYISEEYINGLNDLYESWISSYSLCPIIRVDTSNIDYLHDINHLYRIKLEISKVLSIENLRNEH